LDYYFFMSARNLLNRVLQSTGYSIAKLPRPDNASDEVTDGRAGASELPGEVAPADQHRVYDQDGLRSIHNHDFMSEPSFCKAYQRGVLAAGDDYKWHWRVHVGLWAAFAASKLAGDFIECGVNRGFLSSAIMSDLNWDSLNKMFYLMDTFTGMDLRYVSEEELKRNKSGQNQAFLDSGFYTTRVEGVTENFSEWKNVKIIQGAIPETLAAVTSEKIAYLHLDMNCAPPEVAAFNHFWERLVPGAFVLFDDYSYHGYEMQHEALGDMAASRGLRILSLPTGQGLLIKPV